MFQKPVIQKLGGNTESFKIHYEDGTATSSRNDKQNSCNTQYGGWSGTLSYNDITNLCKTQVSGAAATASRNDLQSSCKTQVADGTATFPLSLCEREQLLTSLRVIRDAGEGLNKGLRSLVKYCDLSLYFFKKIIYNNVMHHNIKHSNIERETYKGATHVTHFGNICQAAFNLVKGNTHVTTYNNIRRAAFTLAEVLITLGIIGVVAAMTMPTLINSTQKQELVAQYKKTYSVLSQAYMMLLNDNGGSLEGVFTSSNSYIDVFSKYIKDVKTCRTNEEVTRCYLDSFKTLNGGVVNSDVGSTLTTPDGAILLFYHINNSCIETTELDKPIGCGRIRVDVNGTKKPNTVGYDIFDFYITQNGIIPRGHKDTTAEEDELNGWGRGITILTKGKIDY